MANTEKVVETEVVVEAEEQPVTEWKPKKGGPPYANYSGKVYNRETKKFTAYRNGKVVK